MRKVPGLHICSGLSAVSRYSRACLQGSEPEWPVRQLGLLYRSGLTKNALPLATLVCSRHLKSDHLVRPRILIEGCPLSSHMSSEVKRCGGIILVRLVECEEV